jgi:tetratricopeptide (TPR) repeat protein
MLITCGAILAAAQDNSTFGSREAHHGFDQMQATLSGTVRTRDGRPVHNARIEVRAIGNPQPVASGYTLPNGGFEFSNIPRGTYEVVATSGVQEARERIRVLQSDSSLQLTFAQGEAVTDGSAGNATVSIAQMKVPEKARKLFAKAQEAFDKQKLAQARAEVEKALQLFPNYAQALTLRGILNLQDSNFDQARTDLETAIKADYSYGMGYIVLGAAYNLMDRFDDSVRVLERGITLMPASWQARYELSKALLGKSQFEAALRQVNKAADLGPSNYPALHLVRAHALLGLKDYNRAVAELEQFLGSDPGSADSAKARETLNQVRSFMASNGK